MNPEQLAAAIADVTTRFGALMTGESALVTSKKDLAPAFMKAYRAWRNTIEDGHDTLSDFVKVIHPTTDNKAHKKALNAATYLRTLTLHKVKPTVTAEERKARSVENALKVVAKELSDDRRRELLAFFERHPDTLQLPIFRVRSAFGDNTPVPDTPAAVADEAPQQVAVNG